MSAVSHTSTGGNGHRAEEGDGLTVALMSAKGSPGVTTAAVGLAARWPSAGAVVLEADPAGGDLAARFNRHFDPGLSAMALDSRAGNAGLEPGRWLQQLPCGGNAVLAPPGPAVAASLVELGPRTSQVLAALAAQHRVVLVDAGRWQPDSAAEAVVSAADVLLILARPMLDDLRQLEVRLPALRALSGDVRLLLRGNDGWPPDEVAASLGVPVVGTLPTDHDGASVLSGRSVPRRGWASTAWTRLPLLRACRSLVAALSESRPGSRPSTARFGAFTRPERIAPAGTS